MHRAKPELRHAGIFQLLQIFRKLFNRETKFDVAVFFHNSFSFTPEG
jgi:hypothetical protein